MIPLMIIMQVLILVLSHTNRPHLHLQTLSTFEAPNYIANVTRSAIKLLDKPCYIVGVGVGVGVGVVCVVPRLRRDRGGLRLGYAPPREPRGGARQVQDPVPDPYLLRAQAAGPPAGY